jgi:predicted DNA-binding protein
MSPKTRLLKPTTIGARIPDELKSRLIKLNESPEYRFETESKIIYRALDHFITELPEVKQTVPQKRDERVIVRVPGDLKNKLQLLVKKNKYGAESESDVVCLALDKFIDDEFTRLKIKGNK